MVERINKILFLAIASLSLLCIFAYVTFIEEEPIDWDEKKLYVVVEKGSPGFFKYTDVDYGYVCSLLKSYAKETEKELHIIKVDHDSFLQNAAADSVTFALVCNKLYGNENSILNINCLTDSAKYVVLVKKGDRRCIDSLFKNGKGVTTNLVSNMSHTHKKRMCDIDEREKLTSLSIDKAIMKLRSNDIDFVVCLEQQGRMFDFTYKDIDITHVFPQYITTDLYVNKKHRYQAEEFKVWLNNFKSTKLYSKIKKKYHEKGYIKSLLKDGFLPPVTGISHYDELFINAADSSIFNWKFLAAIAYQESKFRPKVVSKGAYGMMQVMGSNARARNMDPEDLLDPEINVRVAVEILEAIKKQRRYNSETLSENELKIILACYNAGPGHVADAARLANKYGENSKDWNIIKKYLYLKSEYSYYSDSACVKSGRFRGARITSNYVESIIKRYNKYLNM